MRTRICLRTDGRLTNHHFSQTYSVRGYKGRPVSLKQIKGVHLIFQDHYLRFCGGMIFVKMKCVAVAQGSDWAWNNWLFTDWFICSPGISFATSKTTAAPFKMRRYRTVLSAVAGPVLWQTSCSSILMVLSEPTLYAFGRGYIFSSNYYISWEVTIDVLNMERLSPVHFITCILPECTPLKYIRGSIQRTQSVQTRFWKITRKYFILVRIFLMALGKLYYIEFGIKTYKLNWK